MAGLGGVEHSHWNCNWFSKLKIALIFIFILIVVIITKALLLKTHQSHQYTIYTFDRSCVFACTQNRLDHMVLSLIEKKTVLLLDTIISFHL